MQVDLSKLPSLSQWKREFTMETILIEIRRQAHRARYNLFHSLTNVQIHGRTRAQETASASGGYQLLDGHDALLLAQLLTKMNISIGHTSTQPTT